MTTASEVNPATPAPATLRYDNDVLTLGGDWNALGLGEVEEALAPLFSGAAALKEIDGSGIGSIDSAGSLLLNRVRDSAGAEIRMSGFDPRHLRLLDSLRRLEVPPAPVHKLQEPSFVLIVGDATINMVREAYELLAFLGEFMISLLPGRAAPAALQLRAMGAQLERIGPAAIPIVTLLSFLIGVVIAYQGAVQLRLYGANAFIVELVSITAVRELGPLLAGIIIAGRTGSAIAAEIATMKISNEIDALKTMGMDPVQVLAGPRILALVIALPLLTVVADIATIGGGMAMAQVMLDVGPRDFLARLPTVVSLDNFVAGLVKTPVFAFLIGLIGCHQGMLADQGATGVGQRTTAAVVQSIFAIIVADAVFSIVFQMLGI